MSVASFKVLSIYLYKSWFQKRLKYKRENYNHGTNASFSLKNPRHVSFTLTSGFGYLILNVFSVGKGDPSEII